MIPSRPRPISGMAPRGSRGGPAAGPSRSWVIPYDYAAKLEMTGVPGHIVQDVVVISPDGVFVAVAIGYGFEADRVHPIEIFPPDTGSQSPDIVVPAEITLGDLPPQALIEGFQVNPRGETLVFENGRADQQSRARREREFSD